MTSPDPAQLPLPDPARPAPKAGPFVKWVGGKREVLPALLPHVPSRFGAYFEPFVGGGALFFHLAPGRAVLADRNERLARAYRGVQQEVGRVVDLLRGYPQTKEFYLELRARDIDPATDAEVAAWLIFLNKTGFNGLYRVNSRNRFNVPYGAHLRPNTCDEPTLRGCARALAGATILHADFEASTAAAVEGDFVYFDPPYVPVSPSSSFTSYTAGGFGLAEQERLRDVALRLKRRGVQVLLSNSATPLVERLYSPSFQLVPLLAKRRVNRVAAGRGEVTEYLIK
jgi:DNA adenine methylase